MAPSLLGTDLRHDMRVFAFHSTRVSQRLRVCQTFLPRVPDPIYGMHTWHCTLLSVLLAATPEVLLQ